MSSSDWFDELGVDESEFDDIKRIFTEANYYLVLLTVGVSLLHILLQFTAIKEEIQFYQNMTNPDGVSLISFYIEFIS